MKSALVIPSIQKLNNLVVFKSELLKYNTRVIVVDEGDDNLREYNSKILEGLDYSFEGPEERAEFLGPDVDVIPNRCHAETSFGFLYAYQIGAEVVIELDDDCWRVDPLSQHITNLLPTKGLYIRKSKGNDWFNPLVVMGRAKLFPRGYPYASEARYSWNLGTDREEACVLNMGMWSGQPDLDAATLLSLGGLNGKAGDVGDLMYRKMVIGKDIFFPICSMNTAFRAEIIPAFYQMYMNYEGLDRYCDIWSGLFIKKICDHLGKNISLGQPVVEHRKTERSTFKDLRAEHEGMAINETLWKVVRDMQLEGKDYRTAYDSLISSLYDNIDVFTDKLHRKMMMKQIEKMRKWEELFE